MFRIFSHIVVSLLLLITTTGMAVSKHFCDEFLVSTSYFAETESCCDGDGCCHNETAFFQLQDDFQPSLKSEIPASIEIELISSELIQLNLEDFFCITPAAFAENKPPSPPELKTVLSLKQAYLL